ncbi:MAG: M48 family metallopeptidase [Gammaproteobacteria bacterium]|nr:M48 family metallopeptidase [Gammaproteobacteria bacterium]MCW9030815.1 M48 family metallopeptidase [Gammaproteobacteria bacterium]
MQTFSILFVLALLLSLLIQLWLSNRQSKAISQNRASVPNAFAEHITLEQHHKAADYTLAKLSVNKIELIYGAILLLLWTLGGGLNLIDTFFRAYAYNEILTGLAVIFGIMFISAIIELPFTLFRTFKIEQRYGFNRMTISQFIKDMALQTMLTLVLAVPLISGILWLMQDASPFWWIYVWAVLLSFGLLISWIFPTFIAPLFNKFMPLEDEVLRERITKLMDRCGFSSNGIFVMDGSKRSSHGNAYFTGLGKNKRIVFFDTLLETLEPNEVEAVLAHELGHFKHHHVRKGLILNAIITLFGLALLAWLIKQDAFYHALGVSNASTYMALILFSMVTPLFSIYLQPVMSFISRKHEFEADDFAAVQSKPQTLIKALVKLYRDNANTLTPDSLYSAFHDSHPPAPVRVAHLSAKIEQ